MNLCELRNFILKNSDNEESDFSCCRICNNKKFFIKSSQHICAECGYSTQIFNDVSNISDKKQKTIFNEIDSYLSKHNISRKITNSAQKIYENLYKNHNPIYRTKKRIGLIAACTLEAFSLEGKTTNKKEIEKIFNIKSSDISQGHKILKFVVSHTNVFISIENLIKLNILNVAQNANTILSIPNIQNSLIDYSMMLLKRFYLIDALQSFVPSSAAAAIVKITYNELIGENKKITENIIKIFNISCVTLSNTTKKLQEIIIFVLDEKWQYVYYIISRLLSKYSLYVKYKKIYLNLE